MTPLVRNWIIAAVVCLVCGGAAAVYGPPLAKNMVPQFFVGRAAFNLYREFAPMMDGTVIVNDFLRNSWRQESTLRVSRLEGEFLDSLDVDPAVLSVLPMVALRNITRWDSDREALAWELALQMAATGILSVDFYLDRERMVIDFPALFDFPIAADPRRLGSEWDASLGGWIMPGAIDDAQFYQAYTDMLFAARAQYDVQGFLQSLAGLARYVEFEYAGRQTFDEEATSDVYHVILPAQRINHSLDILFANDVSFISGIRFEDDLVFTLYVEGGRMLGVDFEVFRFRFPEPGMTRFSAEFTSDSIPDQMHSVVSGDISFDDSNALYQSISFDLSVAGLDFTAGAEGQTRVFAERVETALNNLRLEGPDFDISLNVQHMIFPDDEPVVFEAENARLLTDLNISDLLGVLNRIEETPLGAIMEGAL